MQVVIITIASLSQNNAKIHSAVRCNLVSAQIAGLHIYTYNTRINSVFRVLTTVNLLLPIPIHVFQRVFMYVQILPKIKTALCDYCSNSENHCHKVSDHACAICIKKTA